jgi:hypothetical protein
VLCLHHGFAQIAEIFLAINQHGRAVGMFDAPAIVSR